MLSEVLRIVHSAEYQDWHYIIILDESWFYLLTDYEIV
jgi:hypothetical protein